MILPNNNKQKSGINWYAYIELEVTKRGRNSSLCEKIEKIIRYEIKKLKILR